MNGEERAYQFAGEVLEAIREADEQASIAHDYIWPKGGRTPSQEEASDAIWRVHQLLRPFLEDPNPPLTRGRVHIIDGKPCDDSTC